MSPVLNINVFGNFIKIGKKNLISFWAVTDYSRPPLPPMSNNRSLGGGLDYFSWDISLMKYVKVSFLMEKLYRLSLKMWKPKVKFKYPIQIEYKLQISSIEIEEEESIGFRYRF